MPSLQERIRETGLVPGSRVWLAIGAGLLVVVFALLWGLWLPAKIESKFVSAVKQRLNLPVQVGSASAGLFSVRLSEVDLGEGGMSIKADEIYVPTSPLKLAFAGVGGIDRIELRSVKVSVDLTRPSSSELFMRLSNRRRSGGDEDNSRAAAGRSLLPEIEIRQLDVEVRDSHGRLIDAQQVDLDFGTDAKRVSAKRVLVGEEPGDQLELRDATVAFDADLREATVGSGSLRPGADTSRERIAARVLDLRDQVVGRSSGAQGKVTPAERITRLAVQNLKVFPSQSAANPDTPLLDDLSVLAERRGPKPWHLQGEGRPRGDGQLSWNLDVDRDTMTATGNIHFERLPLSVMTPFLPAVPWYRPESTQLSGDLKVKEASAAQASFEARLEVRDLGLASERIASAPVSDISFLVQTDGSWQTGARRLTINTGTVQVKRANATFAGSVFSKGEHWGFDLTATLPSTRCGDAVGAIPTDLLAEVSGFSWQGQIAGSVRAVADSQDLDEAKLRIDVVDSCRFESAPSIAELERYREPFTHRVLENVDEEGREEWFEMSAGPGSSNWTSIWEMSPFFVHAVLAHEDASFFRHEGFAPWAINGAFRRNLKAGRYVVGASTISMQLAKNLFLHREKTLARKAQEVILTWWVENRWDKRKILEMYLNVIEYGPGIYGITEASKYYFGRDPSELSLAESVFLATILPNPKKYHASYARGSLSSGVANKMRFLIRHMERKSRIDAVAAEHGLAEVDRFSFQKPEDGSAPGPRTFVGAAASLPYMMEGPFTSPIATEDMVWESEEGGDTSELQDDEAHMLSW